MLLVYINKLLVIFSSQIAQEIVDIFLIIFYVQVFEAYV